MHARYSSRLVCTPQQLSEFVLLSLRALSAISRKCFQENVELANRMGVLDEGCAHALMISSDDSGFMCLRMYTCGPHRIPNVKLLNAAEGPLAVVTGDTPTGEDLAATLRTTLQSTGAVADAAGFYRSAHARSEL